MNPKVEVPSDKVIAKLLVRISNLISELATKDAYIEQLIDFINRPVESESNHKAHEDTQI